MSAWVSSSAGDVNSGTSDGPALGSALYKGIDESMRVREPTVVLRVRRMP